MAGPASFEISSTEEGVSVFSMRLRPKLPNRADTTMLDFALVSPATPGPSTYGLADQERDSTAYSETFVSCYRIPVFGGIYYRSEAGELIVTAADARQFKGTLEITTCTLVPTGPESYERIRSQVSSLFHARARKSGGDPEATSTRTV